MKGWQKAVPLLGAAMIAGVVESGSAQHAVRQPIDGRPDALVDLRTAEGAALVQGQWRYSDARLVDVASRGPGADLKPSGAPVRTYDIAPHGGAAELDVSRWQRVDARDLERRRGDGRVSFAWYRIDVTIPVRIGGFDTAGSTVVLETVVDDYAEVWVDGRLPRVLGQRGAGIVGGFNAPARVVLSRSARPGERFQVAIFAANGPLSDPPPNFIWIRSATLDFYRASPAASSTPLRIARLDAALDAVVPAGAAIAKLADGFLFTEGPVWVPDGYLLFSDPNANTIYRWSDDEGLTVFRTKSGYTGMDVGEYRQPGSNGLALDREGRLTIAEHGNRRVTRLEKNGLLTVIADRYNGRRLNSPNDLVYRSDGSLYFTDPPFGLPNFFEDPRKELSFSGVYRWADGRLQLLASDLTGPNGLAFSPDERHLYVGNWDPAKKIVVRHDVKADGTLTNATVFADLTSVPGEDAIDGVKVDRAGNVFVSGPGGIWIFAPDGRHLGTIDGPEHPHNFAWGGPAGDTLYVTARTGLYAVKLRTGSVVTRTQRPAAPSTIRGGKP